MSSQLKIILPKLGESIVSATVVQWFKGVGDAVSLDEPLLEVSTDKINSEIPSPAAGVLQEITAEVGSEVLVGGLLAVLAIGGTAVPAPPPSPRKQEEFLTPAVQRLVKEKGLREEEIARMPHTGAGHRLTKKDVEEYRASSPTPAANEQRMKMTPLRKAIAENMVRSFYEAPHASLITEIDVTDLVKFIAEEKGSFLQREKAKLTITSFVARAIARAVKEFPLINSSLDEDTIVMKPSVHLGIAVSIDQGVMVPVIKNSHLLGIAELSRKIAELAEKAREHTLSPDDVKEGSLTMTNFGMTGVEIGIPIIRYPEVAIIGLGAITKQVKVLMPHESMAIRSVFMATLTFDHRVLDGLYGCGFLSRFKKHLEEDLTL
jgi:2-oxoglutarate dehydrogenase E2 component (dihydrolipoamide succinyltransferase)